jgi:hypothetical protein
MPVNDKIESLIPDFYRWPRSWKGMAEDVPVGEELVAAFEPFLLTLIDSGLKKKTIRRHADNLWVLGGEIVRTIAMEPRTSQTVSQVLAESVGPEGGIYCRHLSEESEIRSYDSTCRILWKYLQTAEESDKTKHRG